MVGRMVALLAEGKCEVSEIAAITFTKKAAAELRDRFQVALFREARRSEGEIQRRLTDAAAHVDRGFVGTIHSFCARLLRERPVEAGVDVAFEELDDGEDRLLRKRAWEEHVAALFTQGAPILEVLRRLGLSIGQLEGSFLKLADYPDVTDWPAPPVDPPDLKKLIRDIKKYAARMTEVSAQFVDPTVGDEMAEEYKLIPKLIHVLDLDDPVDVLRLVRRFKKNLKPGQAKWEQLTGGSIDRKGAKKEGEIWEGFVEQTAEPALRNWREHVYPSALEAIRSSQVRYDRLRQMAGRLNYQDLLMKAAALLRAHPEVRRYLRNRFKCLLVDEFQDTDPIQAEVMLLLTANDYGEKDWTACQPVPGSLFVVGDPKQSIYRFRRADIVTYNQVKDILRNSGGEVVTLSTNFRTLEPIVGWVNDLFAGPFNEADKKHSPEYVALQPGRSEDPTSAWPPVSKIVVAGEGRSQAPLLEADSDRIARTLRHALDTGFPIPRTPTEIERGVSPAAQPGDFMILTRTKNHLSLYARKLQEYGIPHLVTGGGGASETEEVLLLKNCIAAIARPDNPVALVALLRGPLFGLDDESLFAFRNAGGEFDYRKGVPSDLDTDLVDRLSDPLQRLLKYADWFARLPLLSAVERIAEDLALIIRCLTGEEGNLSAGSLLKTIEYLRANRSSLTTLSDLVEALENLLEGTEELDGIPASPDPGAVVRIMNLHKAKGLEAPVVFLADPTGGREHDADIHIDRRAEGAIGYLLVQEKKDESFYRPRLAEPKDWENWEQEEKKFLDAEEKRLLYVAATRAGAHLVISRKEVKPGNRKPPSEAWSFFREGLQDCPELPDPGPVARVVAEREPLTREDFDSFRDSNRRRWSGAREKSYEVQAAKQIDTDLLPHHPSQADRGMEWGTLIHLLLETAMKDPRADLQSLARTTVEEGDLDSDWVARSLEVVERVQDSEIWKRAGASAQRFIEIPFQTLKEHGEEGIPIQVRGVVDLIFKEPGGWILVDYKSDRVAESGIGPLMETYREQLANYQKAWERLTQETVLEKYLYLTHLDRLVSLTD
jgi:ATP-dependent helicase/nuclease subunit A